jgi:hypothetical protein
MFQLDSWIQADSINEIYIMAGHKGQPEIVTNEKTLKATPKTSRRTLTKYIGRRKTTGFRHVPMQW